MDDNDLRNEIRKVVYAGNKMEVLAREFPAIGDELERIVFAVAVMVNGLTKGE